MSLSLSWPTAFALCGALTACGADAPFDAPPVADAGPDTASPVDATNPSDAGDSSVPVDSSGPVYANAWAFGRNATRARFDGVAWTIDSQLTPDGGRTIDYNGAWLGPSSLWAVGSNFLVERYHSGTWASMPSPQGVGLDGGSPYGDSGNLAAVWGSAENDVWVIEDNALPGNRPFLHWDGSSWTRADDTASDLSAISGVAPDDIWAAGNQGFATGLVLYHYDSTHHWHLETPPQNNTLGYPGLLGFAHDDWWLGARSAIYRGDGSTWTATLTGPGAGGATSFVGSSDSDLWAAAGGNTMHYDGTKWSPAPTKVIAGVWAVGGASTHDMWAVGAMGGAAHYDGSNWSASTTGTSNDLHAVVGLPTGFGQ